MIKKGRLKIYVCCLGKYIPLGTNVTVEEVISSDKIIMLHIKSFDKKIIIPNTNIDRFV